MIKWKRRPQRSSLCVVPCSIPPKKDGQDDDKEEELFTGEGLYYMDAQNELQGPFTMEQVNAWRPFLPMDLACWILDANDFQMLSEKDGDDKGRKRQREEEGREEKSAADKIKSMVQKLVETTEHVEYSELLGDSALLADYREAKAEGKIPESLSVPSAVQWERAMLYGLPQNQGARAQQGWRDEAAALSLAQEADRDDNNAMVSGSSLSYAEAVLSALPEDDEAVQLSKGSSLKQVIMVGLSAQASGRGSTQNEGPPPVEVDFSAAQRNPLSGKLTAVGSTGPNMRNHLYGELSRYANPEDIERQMAEAAAQRGKTLPPEVWMKLKERRLEVKKKMKLAEYQRY